jgi:hypothetical protein
MLKPLLGIGQSKTVLTANRVFAMNNKDSEFDKALANVETDPIYMNLSLPQTI